MGNEVSGCVKQGLKQRDAVKSSPYPRGPYPKYIGVGGKRFPIKGHLAEVLLRFEGELLEADRAVS